MTDWITANAAAASIGYTPEHVRRLVVLGKVNGQRFGDKIWQIDRRSLLAYVKKAAKLGAKRGPKQSPVKVRGKRLPKRTSRTAR